ncbi:beta-2 adrenergic receptor-like [Acanthaster planci]|uniref:Beta-2 adrenergic receptor-like n=1 Tax=Acanthaster planci TaxID=133434 RepID=A0A8B7XLA3_ACAPL|nr:beta-2 adrenergic receptor-like [Acanthaster planci]
MAEPLSVLHIIKTIIGVIGLIGNGVVATVICKVKFMHTLTNAFICNQAVVDFLGSLFLIVTSTIPVPDPSPHTSACKLWLPDVLLWACFTSSTFNLLSVSCERYVAIVVPFKYATLYTKKSVTCMIVAIWLLGPIFEAPYEAALTTYKDGFCLLSSEIAWFCVVFFLVKLFVPAILMIFFYSHMAVKLKRSANRIAVIAPTVSGQVESAPGDRMGESHRENAEQSLLRARRNIFKTLLLVLITFLVCWTPNQLFILMVNLGCSMDSTGTIYIISVSLVAINSCANPFIYAFKYRRFRRGFLSLIGRKIQTEGDMS